MLTDSYSQWVSSTMAKQVAPVPDEILQLVCEQLSRDRVRPAEVTAKKVRDVLKEKRLRKYYECSMKIACILTGREPPRMSPAEENRLKQRFRQIQAPFEEFRDKFLPDRKNFLSYRYITWF